MKMTHQFDTPVFIRYTTAMSKIDSSRLTALRLRRTTLRSATAMTISAPTAIAYPTLISQETVKNSRNVGLMNLGEKEEREQYDHQLAEQARGVCKRPAHVSAVTAVANASSHMRRTAYTP